MSNFCGNKTRKKTILMVRVKKGRGLLLGSACLLSLGLYGVGAAPAHAFPFGTPEKTSSPIHQSVIQVADEVAQGAENFIRNMANRGLGFLGNKDMSYEQKRDEFSALLNDSFDMKTIGRFALGRYWQMASAEQRKEYLELFTKAVINVYASRFEEYDGEAMAVTGHRKHTADDTIVNSVIVTDGNKVPVDWRVRYKNGKYQVIDVIVEGVSMSVTQRSDFASVIQRGGGNVQVLLAHLRGKQTD